MQAFPCGINVPHDEYAQPVILFVKICADRAKKGRVRAFNVGFGVLRIKTAQCMSVVGAWVGTRDSASRTFVDRTSGGEFCFRTDGGGSANSVVHIISTELCIY
jgi:hypothetical protein